MSHTLDTSGVSASKPTKTDFSKEILDKYADVLIWGLETARAGQGGKYKLGDTVLINLDLNALNLAESLFKKLWEKGLNVTHTIGYFNTGLTPTMEVDFYNIANQGQLEFSAPWDTYKWHLLNGVIKLISPTSLTHLKNISPKKIATKNATFKPYGDIMEKREMDGLFGWTLCIMPTKEHAKQADMSLSQYTEEVIKACHLNKRDPIAVWRQLKRDASQIKEWLNSMPIRYVHIESKNIDLEITIGKHRQWLGVSGHNIPSFEIFTCPDWRKTKGIYYSNEKSFRDGNVVKGARLVFKSGKVVESSAEENANFLKKQLEIDNGAKQLGEFSLTDKRFSPITKFMANTLFDENVGGAHGNCHVAVGFSFPEAYSGEPSLFTKEMKKSLGFNDSALHWDLINTEEKRVTAHLISGDKKMIYEDGMFTI